MRDTGARPYFQDLQIRFAAHLRDPQNPAPEGIEDRRLRVYRELFYNNVERFLAHAFPVVRKLSAEAVWHARVRDFYAHHVCREPRFYKLAEEFLHFLEKVRGPHPDDPPFLAELAHYEWVELALSISETELTPVLADADGDLMRSPPFVSPLAWTLVYTWPVHRLGPDNQPPEPPAEATCLIVYRTCQDEVRFMEINAVTARLMQLVEEHPERSGRSLLAGIAVELRHPQPDQVIEAGREILEALRRRDILLGTRRPPDPASAPLSAPPRTGPIGS
jgi:hypothetical protein